MDLATLLLATAVLHELPPQHRVQQLSHSSLDVVPEGSVGMDRVRVGMGQRMVSEPAAVDRMKEGRGPSAQIELGEAAPGVVAEACDNLDSL